MKKFCIVMVGLVVTCLFSGAVGGSVNVPSGCFDPTEEGIREEILSLINRDRLDLGFAPLTCDGLLSLIAQKHAEDMGSRGYLSHTSPEGVGLVDRLAIAGIRYRLAGENLARADYNARKVVTLWMGSPRHRRNILGDFTKVGIGAYRRYYVLLLIKE